MRLVLRWLAVLFPLLGIFVAWYLTLEHYGYVILPCPAHASFIDCGQVLHGRYAVLFGMPLALLGLIFYIAETGIALYAHIHNNYIGKLLLSVFSAGGFLFSLYLLFLQIFVIRAICLYCMASAFISIFEAVVVCMIFINGKHA